jgi:hypothetical protein
MSCAHCGASANPAYRFCESCGYPLTAAHNNGSNGFGPYPGGPVPAVPPERPDVKRLPGTPILMGDGEVIWRTYNAVQLRTRQHGEGMLFVTDSRVVFYARARGLGTQRPSMLVQQTKLDNVTGLAAYVSRRVSLTLFMLVLFGAFASLISLVTVPPMGILLGIVTLVGIIALIRGAAKRGSTGVILHAGASDASPIGFGQFGEQRSLIGQLIHALLGPLLALFGVHTAFDVLIGFPGEQSEQLVAELGALITDLQNRGSMAASHWSVPTAQPQPQPQPQGSR